MSWPYTYTPYLWPLLAAAVLFTAIGRYAWSRREVPGGKPFLAMSGLSVVVMLAMAFEAAAVAPATKLAWQKLEFLLLFAGVIPVTCLVLDYAYPGRWLTRRNLVLLFLPFLLCLLLAVIDDSRLIWRPLEAGEDGRVKLQFAPGGAILAAYGVGMFLLNAAIFLHVFIRSPLHRWPVALMFAGQLGARTMFLLDTADLPALSSVDLTLFLVLLPWMAYAIALFGLRILEPLPFARQAAIEQMHAGLLVFDAGWRVANLNPAAEMILGISESAARGKTWQQLTSPRGPWPALPDSSTDHSLPPANDPEMTFGTGARARQYEPALSELRDFRGLLVGHMLMLRDVTEERRAQAQVLEQQRSLAMLREREQLARELHDSIGQVLGYVSFQAGSARKLVQDHSLQEADDQLARLTNIAQEAHADVRDFILGLRTGPARGQPFLATLRRYLEGFESNYGIHVELAAGEADRWGLHPDAEMQLFRVVQEALTNARKHAAARCIRVTLASENGCACIAIEDDGRGFDSAELGDGTGSFGLRFMRERAAAIGGELQVHSESGRGTRVAVSVPVQG